MKKDYLWDKTGEDAEIQGLENALKAFRCREDAPPALPQKVFAPETRKRAGFFQLRFAFAGLAAAFVILSLVWFQIGDNKAAIAENVFETNAPKRPAKSNESFINQPDKTVVKTIEKPEPQIKSKVVRAQRKSDLVFRPQKAILRNVKPKEPAETLTAEEQYAYDQLMLALSITGSKLRIVKDKINGIEEQNAAVEAAK